MGVFTNSADNLESQLCGSGRVINLIWSMHPVSVGIIGLINITILIVLGYLFGLKTLNNKIHNWYI